MTTEFAKPRSLSDASNIIKNKMTKSTLIDEVNATGSYYFDKDTMKFFGDSVDNYYLSHAVFDIGGVTCYKLSRKKAVNGGLKSPVYFSVSTFEEVSMKFVTSQERSSMGSNNEWYSTCKNQLEDLRSFEEVSDD